MSPATSSNQRKLFCIAQSIKEGKTPKSFSKQAAKIASTTSLETIKEFCEQPIKST